MLKVLSLTKRVLKNWLSHLNDDKSVMDKERPIPDQCSL